MHQIIRLFSASIQSILIRSSIDFSHLYEIRLRALRPLLLVYWGKEFFLGCNGEMTEEKNGCYCASVQDLRETMEHIAGYSLYAFEDEVRQGFLTVQGGHRVGIAGKVILDGSHVKSMKYISCINVRLAHEQKGCADEAMPYVRTQRACYHTLIVSPPRCGKTTLLRDMIRQLSDGNERYTGCTVGVVDERCELGGCYQGIPQNDLGMRTDILDGCPKSSGMLMLVRSMSPDVIAVDEIGDYEDIHAIETVIHCGCRFLATVHGSDFEDLHRKPLLQRLMAEEIFERYVFLDFGQGAGKIRQIFDQNGKCLYGGEKICGKS